MMRFDSLAQQNKDLFNCCDYQRVLTEFPGMLAHPDGFVDPGKNYVHLVFDYYRRDPISWGAWLR